ncbi:MAG: Rad52/Rad22 family DNA repair protein [Candidatus Angelobacter sp.]
MTAPNGHAGSASPPHVSADNALASQHLGSDSRLSDDRIRQIIGDLEVPFDPPVIEWRVTNTAKDKRRGQVMPYADQRAYTDRLNALVTPAGWTRKYAVHTSANFQRGKDQKTVAKIFVTCELTVLGLGSHSATGEEWADDDNAGTSAEAQAFKRACSCFGLGRYLYYFTGVWVDIDDRKRPKKIPTLPEWATPDGWRKGLRPHNDSNPRSDNQDKVSSAPAHDNRRSGAATTNESSLVRQIEALAEPLGKALYRGLLKSVARVWNPNQIQDTALQQRVLEHMQAAERGLQRLKSALERVGTEPLPRILNSLRVVSLEKVDSLETLKQIVLALEALPPRS